MGLQPRLELRDFKVVEDAVFQPSEFYPYPNEEYMDNKVSPTDQVF
jgi:hypothetical protein